MAKEATSKNNKTPAGKESAAPATDAPSMMEVEKTPEELAQEATAILLADIKQNVSLLERSVSTTESRFTTRVLRTSNTIRKKLTADILLQVIQKFYPNDNSLKSNLIRVLDSSSMETDTVDAKNSNSAQTKNLPEVELYIHLLVLLFLHDTKAYEKGATLSTAVVQQIHVWNRRTLDQLAARAFFYYARFHELTGKLAQIRSFLLAAHRTATLRHDDEANATIINLLLRNYLNFNLIEQGNKLITKSTFPENAGNNQLARYMYYLGRIKAIQLDYTDSYKHLQQAIRKAPQTDSAVGFLQSVQKLSIIVQLLMGEIPERSLFRQIQLKDSLLPYRHITQAVRVGDLNKFQDTLKKYVAKFRADKTYTLILRLRHNVIKAGIRMISLSYSRISLKDICLKLHLDCEEDAEYIVSKAIRDGVIDAVIDHENGFVRSKENIDIYSTNEPQNAFHQRISFCLNLHNESVKAMRYPSSANREDFVPSDQAREREVEIAEEIAKGEFDDDEAEF